MSKQPFFSFIYIAILRVNLFVFFQRYSHLFIYKQYTVMWATAEKHNIHHVLTVVVVKSSKNVGFTSDLIQNKYT